MDGVLTYETDTDDIHTALREAEEEISLDPGLIVVVTVLFVVMVLIEELEVLIVELFVDLFVGLFVVVFVEENWSHGAEGKDSFVKCDMTRNDNFVGVQVKAPISAMIVRVPEKDRWCGTRGKFVRWKGVRITKASKRAKVLTYETDTDDIHTALREAEEEISLDPGLIVVVTVLELSCAKYNEDDVSKSLKYFLGIKVSCSIKVICHSQRKYYPDLLDDACQIEAKPCDEPMIPKLKLKSEAGRSLQNPEIYRRVGTSRLDILYVNHGHHIAEGFIDADYTGCPNTSRSTTGYCVFVGGNLVCWKSKKQNVVSRSSLEAEYRAMTQTTCELVWLRNLLGEIGFTKSKPMKMWCDNQTTIYIATNPMFHEKTKHIEVNCHFTREKLEDWTITTLHIRTESQLADVLTKALLGTHINSICNKLGMISIYAHQYICFSLSVGFLGAAEEESIFLLVSFDKFPVLIEYFSQARIETGLEYLKRATEKRHVEATYVYGMILLSRGGQSSQQGLNILNSMKVSRSNYLKIRECRAKIKSVIREMWINNSISLNEAGCKCQEKNICIRKRNFDEEEDVDVIDDIEYLRSRFGTSGLRHDTLFHMESESHHVYGPTPYAILGPICSPKE
ncbi:uncharacterized mitochondrial protein-like protein [Tanacetum coccineum]